MKIYNFSFMPLIILLYLFGSVLIVDFAKKREFFSEIPQTKINPTQSNKQLEFFEIKHICITDFSTMNIKLLTEIFQKASKMYGIPFLVKKGFESSEIVLLIQKSSPYIVQIGSYRYNLYGHIGQIKNKRCFVVAEISESSCKPEEKNIEKAKTLDQFFTEPFLVQDVLRWVNQTLKQKRISSSFDLFWDPCCGPNLFSLELQRLQKSKSFFETFQSEEFRVMDKDPKFSFLDPSDLFDLKTKIPDFLKNQRVLSVTNLPFKGVRRILSLLVNLPVQDGSLFCFIVPRSIQGPNLLKMLQNKWQVLGYLYLP
jgi:hypothetical protein